MTKTQERRRGATIGLYFANTSKVEANQIRARLNDIAFDLGYKAERGKTAGDGNAAALLVAIANGEVQVVPNNQHS